MRLAKDEPRVYNFLLGLFLLYSISPVLKILMIREIQGIPDIYKIALFYFLQLSPLYIIIYVFVLSFVSPKVFILVDKYVPEKIAIFKHMLKSYYKIFFIFTNLSFVYIVFDINKGLINSKYFSYQDVLGVTPVYIFNDSLMNIDVIKLFYVVMFLLPTILIISLSAIFKKNVFPRISIDASERIWLGSFIEKSRLFGWGNDIKTEMEAQKDFHYRYFLESIMVYFPWLILLFIIVFVAFSELNLLSLNFSYLIKVYLSSLFISSVLVYAFVIISIYLKKIIPTISNLLLIFALIPGDVLCAYINNIHVPEINLFGMPLLELQLILGFVILYGLFPVFFLSISAGENKEIDNMAKLYIENDICIRWYSKIKKRIEVFVLINTKSLKLSIMFLSILILNDTVVTSGISITDMKTRSIAYAISEMIKTAQYATGDPMTILLIIGNILVVLLAPYYKQVIEIFNTPLSIMLKIFG